ncbi:related to AMI1 protein [Cephalotrichum gorgonifer]|uniref:Related to AMI1 protein n=1 Tax=Cephalotrichum gorgonifer TaxID=2041049 RepID=A0AAE8MTH7_9PEZI|nr:related to AMI1 protein [Cephalotrichum gorgonifer]
MASSFGHKSLASEADKENDPFVTSSGQPPLRYSGFDSKLFALGPSSSPRQAKRALEAHLAETERRMAEAGKLGTALVQQQKELRDRLAEVESQELDGQLSGELGHKLAEIEKDYNEVARQTARAFLPKQRIPSNEAAGGSPYVPEGKGGRRSVSPSKFESHATGSPTKLSVPNRKLRNQPANRIHDIEFAAEISTSLISQVRNLQALLSEKDDELRDATNARTRLEIDAESLQQRLKELDESEHRYKDENWTLETQLQELFAAQKEAAEREKRLTQSLNVLQSEKNKTQRELDEVKVSHAKLSEDHTAAIKLHDIELGTAKRSIAAAENERSTLQRKVDDLTNQNQELARAFSSSQRAKMLEREGILGMSEDDFESAADNITPEHSPPPSPVKGTTPRHSMLESETLKTSLHHAQRTIQSQRTQLHREKTEKLELKRMLQDVRDEVERLRGDGGGLSSRRTKKSDARDLKRHSKLLLGSARTSREEIYMEDQEWEDHLEESSPRLSLSRSVSPGSPSPTRHAESTDQFETANETSDAAFETANERGTETEDFQTGAEEFSGSESEATETESPSRGGVRRKLSNIGPLNFRRHPNRESFHSTASTSNDEDAGADAATPPSAPPRMRLRVSRGLLRRSRQTSEEPPAMQGSPAGSQASYANSSTSGTPRQGGQSLFAELADFDGSGDESYEGTPSRTLLASPESHSRIPGLRSIPSIQRLGMVDSAVMTDPSKPGAEDDVATPTLPKFEMVDSGTNTEPMEEPASIPSMIGGHVSMGIDIDPSRRISSYSDSGAQSDLGMEDSLSKFPLPPSSAPQLDFTSIETQDVTPVAPEVVEVPPPSLTLSSIQKEVLEPKAEPIVPAPALSISEINAKSLDPRAEPEPVPAPLSISGIRSEALDPRAEPEILPPAPELTVSQMHVQALEPDATPLDTLAAVLGLSAVASSTPHSPALARELNMASIHSETVEPKVEPEAVLPELSMTSINSQDMEPVVEREVIPDLGMATIDSQSLEPVADPEILPELSLVGINSQGFEPVAEEVVLPELRLANINSQGFEPVAEDVVLPELRLTNINSQELAPVSEPEPPAPEPLVLGLSTVRSEHIYPIEETKPEPALLTTSTIRSESVAPVKPPSPVKSRPEFAFTSIQSLDTKPVSPRSPKRDMPVIPPDSDFPFGAIPKKRSQNFVRGSVLHWDSLRTPTPPPIIAEDETRQSPRQTPQPETPESQRPLQSISINSNVRPRKPGTVTLDSSAQTALTSDALDQMMRPRQNRQVVGHERQESLGSSIGMPGTLMRRGSEESTGSVVRHKIRATDSAMDPLYRPSSATSSRAPMEDLPPLPANHKEVIEAARTGSSGGGQGSMGPPLWPASAMRNARPRTPIVSKPSFTSIDSTTPRAGRAGTATVLTGTHPAVNNLRSRQSSITSFASELDNRFNMPTAGPGIVPGGFGPNTDPRMIQAITQTMIGEFLWKYTRKTGRGEMSENRHRRYFWVHPYTRTLYWSDRDPSTAAGQRSELKAKSIPIEAVRVVTDDNPFPPGLPRKSLIVISPGRTVKFTCTTNQRHEIWFNALSYLLLRTNEDGRSDAESMADHITREDVDEFNPQFGRRQPQASTRRGPRASLSSYNSSRNESPAMGMSMNIPTLTNTKRTQGGSQRPSFGTLTRLSGYWKSSQTFSSMRSRRTIINPDVYETGDVHDSAEDVRAMIEQQDRESDRLENVRACCDGKHDVGTLTGKNARHFLSHAHPVSASATPSNSTRSRV